MKARKIDIATLHHLNQRHQYHKIIEFEPKKMPSVKSRQIRLYYVGMNVGGEIRRDSPFTRPCLILQGQYGRDLALIAPISGQMNEHNAKYYYEIPTPERYGLTQKPQAFINLNQIKSISKKRLIRKMNDTRDKDEKRIPFVPVPIQQEIITKRKNLI